MRASLPASLLVALVTPAGCGGSGDPPGPDPSVLTTTEVTPASTTLFTVAPGNTVQLATIPTEIRASLTAGSVSRTGTAIIAVEVAPSTATVTAPALEYVPRNVDVGAGGNVTWSFGSIPHTVTFSTAGAGRRPRAGERIRLTRVSEQRDLRVPVQHSPGDVGRRAGALMAHWHDALNRREFLRLAASGTALMGDAITALSSCDTAVGPDSEPSRSALPAPAALAVTAAVLVAAPGLAATGGSEPSPAWLFNGLLPGPTLRARQGEQTGIRLVNQLPEPTIVHWHGVIVPDHADGHPRHAIDPGASFDYEFPVVQRAGTFWYHPHPHHRTAGQIHRGLAGFFIVTDAEEDALNLPSGPFEILVLLQDRDGAPAAAFGYAPTADDLHSGMLRDVPLPILAVTGARYRFRVLNASQARVYRLALDNRATLTVIGNDGGLLPSPVEVDSAYLGVGERIDFLVDFATFPPGSRTMLKSRPFPVPSAPVTPFPQGIELDLLELVRDGAAGAPGGPLPAVLSSAPEPGGAVVGERSIVLRSIDQEHGHRINDHTFVPERVDQRISLGQAERWTFRNDSSLPHPVHLHGTQFQILSRTGGRNVVFPYEAGWKDTALVMPLEAVEVLVRFDRYPGLFPLHCHNLQHEDLGMMLNVEVT